MLSKVHDPEYRVGCEVFSCALRLHSCKTRQFLKKSLLHNFYNLSYFVNINIAEINSDDEKNIFRALKAMKIKLKNRLTTRVLDMDC